MSIWTTKQQREAFTQATRNTSFATPASPHQFATPVCHLSFDVQLENGKLSELFDDVP